VKKKPDIILFSIIICLCILVIRADAVIVEYQIDLEKPIPLKLRYPIGKALHYRLIRHSDIFLMDGNKSGEQNAVAYFTRKRVGNTREGQIQEKFTWEKFGSGESFDLNQPVKLTYLEEAEGFTLTCCMTDEDLLTQFDFSSLPRTLPGMWFMIMSWDAVTFDGAVRPQNHYDFPDTACIGTEFQNRRGPYDFPFAYPPLIADSLYTFSGKNHAKIIGLGMVKKTPCAIIEFSHAENRIIMNMNLNTMKMKIRSLEHFFGKTYLSLEDGSIVKGVLTAPVAQVQDVHMPGQENQQHRNLLIMQRLEMELLSAEEFNKEISKN
jgi:hypothetical protein